MLVKSLNQHRPTICSREQHGRVMVRRVWIESWKHGLRFRGDTNPLTIGYNKHVLDNSIKHIRASVPKIILKPVCHVVGSIPRERSTSPTPRWWHAAGLLTYRSFVQPSQLCQLTVDSWQLTVSQWLIRIWTSDCESQQRDCAGLSPASLTLNAVQRYNKKCTYARKRTLFYKKIIDFYLFVPFYLTMGACLQ